MILHVALEVVRIFCALCWAFAGCSFAALCKACQEKLQDSDGGDWWKKEPKDEEP